MKPSARLLELEIEGFRGFAHSQTISLDADAVLIFGGNGTGKTSLADAVIWALTGSLPRLDELLRGLRAKNEEHISNRYSSNQARVRLDVQLDGRLVRIERHGSSEGSTVITSVDGVSAQQEPWQALQAANLNTLQMAATARSLLAQDAMRGVLAEGPVELHAQLRKILGLHVLDKFESATVTARAKINAALKDVHMAGERAKDALEQVRRQKEKAQAEQAKANSEADLNARLQQTLQSTEIPFKLLSAELSGPQLITAICSDLEMMVAVAPALAQALEVSASTDASVNVDALRQSSDAAEKRFREASEREQGHRQLARAALQLLDSCCPVCQQPIDVSQVAAKLNEQVQNSASNVSELQREYNTQRGLLRSGQEQAERRERAVRALEATRSRWQQVTNATCVTVQIAEEPAVLRDLVSKVTELTKALHELYRQYAGLSNASDLQVIQAEQTMQALVGDIQTLWTEELALLAHSRQADQLVKVTREATLQVTTRALRRLEPAFAEIYERLSPHPSFTQLGMSHKVQYGKGRTTPLVSDPYSDPHSNTNKGIHPGIVLSEGQLSIVALSYFVAMALTDSTNPLPFLWLDDPLQSLDTLNVLGLADFGQRLRENRQLIIGTHDRRFARILEHKLTPRNPGQKTLLINLGAWTTDGPTVNVRTLTADQPSSLLQAA
jgi:DNA repair exonuclease SbcCD ATPase subunit